MFSFEKMHFKMSSAKWLPFCLGLNVLMGALTFLLFFLICFLLKLIVACRLCIIYVREDNDSNE